MLGIKKMDWDSFLSQQANLGKALQLMEFGGLMRLDSFMKPYEEKKQPYKIDKYVPSKTLFIDIVMLADI